MSRRGKKITRVLLVFACLMLLAGSAGVQADAGNMKTATKGIRWGIKVGKKYKYYSYWGGVGMIAQNVKVTRWKDTWSGNKGMRRLTFRITYVRKKKPTAKQLVKAAEFYTIRNPEITNTSPRCYYAVVDYDTGISLEDPKNPYGVIVSNNGWRQSKKTIYKTKGYSIAMTNAWVDVSIEYPYTYRGICIGVGGTTGITETSSDKLFWDGIYPFWMTDTLRSPGKKKVARFARWWYD